MPSIRFEICNKCNLTCPSCQEGRLNFAHQHEPFHYADVELCRKIFERIHAQNEHFDIYLYMFCEPCLHPQLDEILDIMDEYGLTAYISSNLNVKHDWERLLSHSSLKRLTVSISGMSQEVYEKGQRGGNFSLLMQNMQHMAALPEELKSKVLVFFHQYNDNAEDEEQCRALCSEYGFEFVPSPAFFMYSPWDAVKSQPDILLQDGISNVFSRLFVQQKFLMESMSGLKEIPCALEFAKDIAIDSHGYVHHRCCLVPLSKETRCGHFLEMSFDDMYRIEKFSKTCVDCKNNGFHVQFSFVPHVEYTMLAKHRSHDAGMPNINERIRAFIKRQELLPSLKNVPIYLYGMVGNAGIITLLQHQGYDVRGILDDNTEEQGRTYCRLPVLSLAEVPSDVLSHACIIICFIRERRFIEEFKQKLLTKGAKSVYALYELFLLQE